MIGDSQIELAGKGSIFSGPSVGFVDTLEDIPLLHHCSSPITYSDTFTTIMSGGKQTNESQRPLLDVESPEDRQARLGAASPIPAACAIAHAQVLCCRQSQLRRLRPLLLPVLSRKSRLDLLRCPRALVSPSLLYAISSNPASAKWT
jgi:hypothetical protein